MNADFWSQLDTLLENTKVVIDRPKGSEHPNYPGAIYPVDYGYLEGTRGSDGEAVDVWAGSEPGAALDAIVCTVDGNKGDAELKLLVGCTPNEKAAIVVFLNTGAMAAILIERP